MQTYSAIIILQNNTTFYGFKMYWPKFIAFVKDQFTKLKFFYKNNEIYS